MSDAKPAEIAPASIVEIDDVDEGDSSFGGDDSDSAISASITSSILNYEYTNGRRYTGYRRGEYLLPNDETEQDRLDLLHHVFLLLNDGKLLRSPISPNPQRALDIGTGTGIWALDFADQYQSAQVIGLDLSPIQPSWVPPNLKFYIDDVEKEWAYGPDDAFDVIHARQMGGSIGNWEKLAKSCFDHMKPGGWIELQEPQTLITSDDDTSSKATATNEFLSLSNKAAEQFGKELNMAPKYKQYLLDAGFVDVKDEVFKVCFYLFSFFHFVLAYKTFMLTQFLSLADTNWPVGERSQTKGSRSILPGTLPSGCRRLHPGFHWQSSRLD